MFSMQKRARSSSKPIGSNGPPYQRTMSRCCSCAGSRTASKKSMNPCGPPTSSGGQRLAPSTNAGYSLSGSHRSAHTVLVHVFGRGLDGDRYVVERFRSRPDGQIHPVEAEQPKGKTGGRKQRRTVVSASEVKKMKPERDEIIICTALNLKASGVQIWGLAACGISAMRYAR